MNTMQSVSKKQSWFVYMIETDQKHLYTGISKDVEKRFKKHQSGKGAKFFRMHTPKKIVYSRSFKSKELALQKEWEIKKLDVEGKWNLIKKKTKR
jgi:putative endonuclease